MTQLKDYLYYQDDWATIYNADCRDILPLLGPVDLVLTDPPYGFNRFETDGKDYLDSVGPALISAFTKLKPDHSMFVFTGTGEIVRLSNAIGLNPKRVLWMYKPNDCTYPLQGWLLKSEAILETETYNH